MDENEDLDLINDTDEGVDRKDKRFKDLSEKVKTTAEERDKLAKAKDKADADRLAAEKELDFFKNFSQVTSKYSGAADFQEQIKEKVLAGYDMEDAAISILAKQGKFTSPPAPKENPAGGSATNTIQGSGDKTIAEMDQAERRAILEKNLDIS